jgi:hypothetical protein
MYARMYRQRSGASISGLLAMIRGRAITARFWLARWRIEAPMHALMYRQQFASWIGSHAPGWGALRRIAKLKRKLQSKRIAQTTPYAPVVVPPVRDHAGQG